MDSDGTSIREYVMKGWIGLGIDSSSIKEYMLKG